MSAECGLGTGEARLLLGEAEGGAQEGGEQGGRLLAGEAEAELPATATRSGGGGGGGGGVGSLGSRDGSWGGAGS